MLIEEEKTTYRCVTIGDSSVGKTSIVNKFLLNKFNPSEPNTIGTLYESFSDRRDGRDIEVQIWDTAGQDQYRSLGPIYYRSSAAAILVFDITKPDTFQNLGTWLSAFRDVAGENNVIFVVGNKVDLEDKREVTSDEGEMWAKKNGCHYIETSANDGTRIKELFELLVDELIRTFDGENNMRIIDKTKTIEINNKPSEPESKIIGCC